MTTTHYGAEVVVIMGVMGSGKSAVGRALASRLGCTFQEGDDAALESKEGARRHGVRELLRINVIAAIAMTPTSAKCGGHLRISARQPQHAKTEIIIVKPLAKTGALAPIPFVRMATSRHCVGAAKMNLGEVDPSRAT